jgi:hypothetical protein
MALPIFKDDNKNLMLVQTNWSTQLDPVINQPLSSGVLLKNIQLKMGSNQINHLLQKRLTGWFIVRQRGAASVYDTQDTNMFQDLTLLLTSTAAVSVDLMVF